VNEATPELPRPQCARAPDGRSAQPIRATLRLRARANDAAPYGTPAGERTLAHAVVASLGQRLLPRLRISLSRYPRKGVVLAAVGIRIKLPGVTQEQFDAAHDHINPDRSPWPGLLFHSSGPIDGGWGVIDFWESRADFDAHLESNIQPGIAASGVQMQGPPDIKEFPVHEIIHP
jgi:hypothetical protein